MKYLLLCILLWCNILHAKDYSAQDGNWETGSTWVKGVEPIIEDTIVIDVEDTVTITNSNLSYDTDVVIIIKGALFFDGGKLKLTEDSKIKLIDGLIYTVSNGNNDKIFFGNNSVWTGNDGNISGDYTLTNEDGVLPVTWGYIRHSMYGNIITLYWSTHTEKNNDRFEIETSQNLEDWSVVAEVDGTGTAYSETHYQTRWIEHNNIYIRITQIDFNGDSDKSDIIYARILASKNKKRRILYYVDLKGTIVYGPHGYVIAIYDSGEKEPIFFK